MHIASTCVIHPSMEARLGCPVKPPPMEPVHRGPSGRTVVPDASAQESTDPAARRPLRASASFRAMPDPPRLELSAMGAVRPPAESAVAAAARREAQGFDAVWWADHFLHWFPYSIWTPDLVPQAAAGQASPHVWFDPVPIVAAAAGATSTVRLGIGVTDLVRRHPASLAQTAL